MQRFLFFKLPLGNDITVRDDSFIHQISRVLRCRSGENIVLFNGDGQEYLYTIACIGKKEITLSFWQSYINTSDSNRTICLFQAIPNKYEKIEYILQKGTEVWVKEFVFFRSDRSQRLVINERKIERFHEIIKESTEQSGWNEMPSLIFIDGWIPVPENGQSYMFHTEESESKYIRDIDVTLSPINLFVGPEGGWSLPEILLFQERNIQKIHLWKRILRTETTGVVASFFLIQK